MASKKLIHYINQFYGGIGGEDKANHPPEYRVGAVGPGVQLQGELGDGVEIVGTIICGDNYFAENTDEVLARVLDWAKEYKIDGLVAGPAFNAGRYGMACGAVSEYVKLELDIPVVTGMYHENPGAEIYNKYIHIMKTGDSAASMRQELAVIAAAMKKLLAGEDLGWPEEAGYIPMGFRVNLFVEKTGAERAVDMMLQKLRSEPFTTELPMPDFNRVDPAPAVHDMKNAKVALVTSGGIVPAGNPDRIESANATKWGKYNIANLDDFKEGEYITVHGGYDPVYALADADRVLPLDALRELEKEGEIGRIHDFYYSTVGNTTAVSSAERFGEEMAQDMLSQEVQAAILTST